MRIPMNPSFDLRTLEHIQQTSKTTIPREVYIPKTRQMQVIMIEAEQTPHHPQYSIKNKRYECGCGFMGEILDFEISTDPIPRRRANVPQPSRTYHGVDQRSSF